MARGDPRPDRVLLWTRFEGDAIEVTWEVTNDDSFDDMVARGKVTVTAATDHAVKVVAKGL